MKVLQVVAGIGHESSGTSTVVPRMCESLVASGCEVELHTLNPLPAKRIDGVRVMGHAVSRLLPSRLGASVGMRWALKIACTAADIVQTNGLWMMPNIYPNAVRRGTTCKFVIMPHGMLSSWALRRSRFLKWICLHALGQKRALEHADMFVATCEKEYHEIRACGYRQPVAVVPMGIDVPKELPPKRNVGMRTLAFLGRIHPVKRVEALIRVWRKIQNDFPDWQLKIAGPLDAYGEEMRRLAERIGCARCGFVGEVSGKDKDAFYRDADLFVLPSHTENFGAVVAEALACGTPVVTTKGTPWEGVVAHECGRWIDVGDEALERTLRLMMVQSRDDLAVMGERGRDWMLRDFGWGQVGIMLKAAYEWLCYNDEKPGWVNVVSEEDR